jgi:hypothetical protein
MREFAPFVHAQKRSRPARRPRIGPRLDAGQAHRRRGGEENEREIIVIAESLPGGRRAQGVFARGGERL